MEAIINLRKMQVVTDAHLEIPFSSKPAKISYKERILEEGREYRLAENTLILSANFLLSLPSYPLGEVAVLNCISSDGGNWIIKVNQLDALDEKEKTQPPSNAVSKKKKAVRFAIGGAGLLAIAAITKIIVSRKKE